MSRIDYEQRVELIKALREMGVDPYPADVKPEYEIKEIVQDPDKHMGSTVSVAGRIHSIRLHGNLAFADLRQNGFQIQIMFRKDIMGAEEYSFLKKYVDKGDFLWVKGEVMVTKRGELSVQAERIRLAAKAMYDLPHEWFGIGDIRTRYRKRYLDILINRESFDLFQRRSRIISALRRYLEDMGLMEMETPILQPLYGGANAKPFKTHVNAIDRDYYLRISDELYLKRLIVAGYDGVFEIARDFRNEDIDTTHNPEFTMVEVYKAYADYNDMMDLTERLIKHLADREGIESINLGGREIDLMKPFRRLRMLDMLREKGITEETTDDELKEMLERYSLQLPAFNRGQALGKIFERLCEDELVEPVFVIDHPKETTPLCKLHRDDPSLIERFELYIGGMELANGYSELNDPELQEKLFKEEAERRDFGDVEAHEYDEDFIEALRWGMPPTGGVGIGIDRLVMVLTGKESIKEVLLFPLMAPTEDNQE